MHVVFMSSHQNVFLNNLHDIYQVVEQNLLVYSYVSILYMTFCVPTKRVMMRTVDNVIDNSLNIISPLPQCHNTGMGVGGGGGGANRDTQIAV